MHRVNLDMQVWGSLSFTISCAGQYAVPGEGWVISVYNCFWWEAMNAMHPANTDDCWPVRAVAGVTSLCMSLAMIVWTFLERCMRTVCLEEQRKRHIKTSIAKQESRWGLHNGRHEQYSSQLVWNRTWNLYPADVLGSIPHTHWSRTWAARRMKIDLPGHTTERHLLLGYDLSHNVRWAALTGNIYEKSKHWIFHLIRKRHFNVVSHKCSY